MARESGIGTYIRNLVPRIAESRAAWHLVVLGHRDELEALGWGGLPNVELRDCRARIYTIAEQWDVVRALPGKVDLFWSPHYNVPLLYRGPLVVTVHDVFHLAMREEVPAGARRAYARTMFGAVRRRARE